MTIDPGGSQTSNFTFASDTADAACAEVGTETVPISSDTHGALVIGNLTASGGNGARGWMDDVRLYRVALPVSQIQVPAGH